MMRRTLITEHAVREGELLPLLRKAYRICLHYTLSMRSVDLNIVFAAFSKPRPWTVCGVRIARVLPENVVNDVPSAAAGAAPRIATCVSSS